MLSFDENGWLYPDPLNNITHDIDSAKIKDLLKLARGRRLLVCRRKRSCKKTTEKR